MHFLSLSENEFFLKENWKGMTSFKEFMKASPRVKGEEGVMEPAVTRSKLPDSQGVISQCVYPLQDPSQGGCEWEGEWDEISGLCTGQSGCIILCKDAEQSTGHKHEWNLESFTIELLQSTNKSMVFTPAAQYQYATNQ